MKVVLFPHLQKGCAPSVAQKMCLALHRNGMEVLVDPVCQELLQDMPFIQYVPFLEAVQDADVAIAIGGDGTILHCARHVVGTKAKLLGVNTGRVGFLASMEPDQIGEVARLQTGDYRVSRRMLLHGVLRDASGTCVRNFTALNDIVISRNFSRVAEFSVSRNHVLLGEYRADGVIFSTPTGSTAYALSAGGPIIEPEFACVEMTLICPHALSARPILFSPQNDLEVRCSVREGQNEDVFLSADGEKAIPFPAGHVLEISGSEQTVDILDLSGNTFFDSLSRKLMQPLKDRRS
ncbi:NAD(+)/NADH kinase [Ruminococcus sp.]|jgi:NAD+ kinase|uniref:NAD(+)/NADH kinase n=1 Tax=Ruminococcus sp. TaxID=41978 RepID=UPI002637185A|nr:NAD(+)/NADH kinase [Ruminococcus sp.]MEE0022915.1 NAD(+)/NADH kinase [Ruminococcus sp.]